MWKVKHQLKQKMLSTNVTVAMHSSQEAEFGVKGSGALLQSVNLSFLFVYCKKNYFRKIGIHSKTMAKKA